MNSENLKKLFLKIENTTLKETPKINFNLKELLILEKRRLGFKKDDMVFISAGDISKYYWCPMQTYFTIIDHELDKFSGYLQDKIEYSIKLDKLKEIPKTNKELLKIGDNLTIKEIYELLKRKEYQNITNKETIIKAKKELKLCKTQTEKGHHLETIHAKKYSQIHWFTKYNNFIFTCEPDGITKNFVYEFKSSKNRYFSKESIKKAKLQADIYGICFNKKEKIIDQLIVSENKIEIIKEKINIDEVNQIINEIKQINTNNLPKPPKEKFKCKNCEYKDKCLIKQI